MSSPDVWITIALLTLATILTRGSFFMMGHAVKLPPKVQHALRYAPAAAMAAIVAPDLLMTSSMGFDWANPKLLAGIGATAFFLVTRHLLGTIIAGMALLTVIRILH